MFLFCSACSILSLLFWDKKKNDCVGKVRAHQGSEHVWDVVDNKNLYSSFSNKGWIKQDGAGDLVTADGAGIVFSPWSHKRDLRGWCERKK